MSVPRAGQLRQDEQSEGTDCEQDNTQDTAGWRSVFEKRRHAFEREPTNIKLLDSPGMVFSPPPQRDVPDGQDQESSSNHGDGSGVHNELSDNVSMEQSNSSLPQRSAPVDLPTLPLHMRRNHTPADTSANSRNSIDGQRLPFFPEQVDERRNPLRANPTHNLHNNSPVLPQAPPTPQRPRPPSQTPGDLAIGEETGQKEQVFNERRVEGRHVTRSRRPDSPSNGLMSQSDDSERDDSVLSQQIAVLTMQNVQLQQQLREREVERDRLSKQLEEKNVRSIYSPPGLPSRVLDGRKVLRDSLPFSITPPIQPTSPRPLTPYSPRPLTPITPLTPLHMQPPLSPRLDNPPTSPLLLSQPPMLEDHVGSEVKNDILQLETLRRTNRQLEQRLVEVSEEKRRIESELFRHKETLVKVQEREQDLTQDIKTLRTENSHHTGAITKLQSERDSLKSSNTTLLTKLTTLTDKLTKTEKCYKEVEQENLSLEADIEQLVREKDQLFEEKENLQSSVEDAWKTKENYRSTIRQLRDQNLTLEGQLSGDTVRRSEEKEVKVQSSPVTKGQQVLNEVLSLREEKSHLKGKLLNAQQEIDSLEAHLKVQETQEEGVHKFRSVLTAHLVGFQNQVSSISEELESTRNTVAVLSAEQKSLVHDGFLLLVDKCREQLELVAEGKGQIAETLSITEKSLDALQEDFDKLKMENSKLVSQKSSVSTDVSKLQSAVQSLQDQKKMFEVQLAQGEVLAQQRDEEMQGLQEKNEKLENRYKTSEKNWKNEFGRLEREWEGRVAEATQAHELLLDEKESLEVQKNELEEMLLEVRLENRKLSIAKGEVEGSLVVMENQLNELSGKFTEKEILIYKAEQDIARLLVDKSLLAAQVHVEGEVFEKKLTLVQREKERDVETQREKNTDLVASLNKLEEERSGLHEKLALVAKKEAQIVSLTTRVATLTSERTQLNDEMKVLDDEHKKALLDFQSLIETEQRRQLENEKLKMTLTTEIELLKTKLKSVEEGKEVEAIKDKSVVSAFQAIPQTKHVEQLRKQILALQQESQQVRSASNHDSNSSRLALAELQTRLVTLEVENSKLKDVARGNQESMETMTNLRKQVSELSRKSFFLESEKKQLTDKLHTVQANLKLAREMKDRLATDRMQKLQDDNQIFQERVRGLEGSLTKKMMTADLKIVQTVQENDRLRQKLVQVYSTMESEKKRQATLKELLPALQQQSIVLDSLRTSIADTKYSVLQLESNQHTVADVQPRARKLSSSSLKQIDVSTGRSVTFIRNISTSSGPSSPACGVPTLQKTRGSGSRSGAPSPVPMATAVSSQLKDKVDQFAERNEELTKVLQKQQEVLNSYEAKIASLSSDFSSLVSNLELSLAASFELYETVSSLNERELKQDQLKMVSVLRQQVESLQDQVIDRDVALQDIEVQMKKDYGLHDKKFASLKSQVIELREQLSSKDNHLRTKDLYIQQLEEKQLEFESQLYQLHKEVEREKRELLSQALPESLQRQFAGSQPMLKIPDVIRVQGEEIHQLQKVVREFTFEIGQLQGQLDTVQREKGMLQSKTIELERMHIQMKEAMTADITYLRKLNLQLVEQHMKAEKATEILKEVKGAQEMFRKQRNLIKMEAELDSSKLKLHEQSRKMYDLERQLANQNITIKLLQAEKDHAFLLTQHAKDLTNQIGARSAGYLRPRSAEARSAESARKPNYRIADSKPRFIASGRHALQVGEFSIPFPITNSSQVVDILNLEEQPEHSQAHIQLGPTVVTDDEYSTLLDHNEKSSKQPRLQKTRMRGHRRTASTGSNILPPLSQDSEPVSVDGHSGVSSSHLQGSLAEKQKGVGPKYPRRPGSAGSTRHDVRGLTRMASPEHVSKTARELSEYMSILIDDTSRDEEVGVTKQGKTERKHSPIRGRTTSLGGVPLASQSGLTKYNFTDTTRTKLSNKSTDSSGTSSSGDGKSSSDSGTNAGTAVTNELSTLNSTNQERSIAANPPPLSSERKLTAAIDRTESMSSSCSTLSIFQPSRNPSFSVYDGGESSPYSQTSVEIGDSVENLQALSKLGYNPYMLSIYHPKHETTSSSDEDYAAEKRLLGRRKRSSGTGNEGSHDTPRHKDMSDNSNSSCDSDQLQQQGYHGNQASNQRGGIPVHRNESISISDMEKYSTDAEAVERKAADLQHRFGRKRYSSTGSVKICYSESSNTSLEDITRS